MAENPEPEFSFIIHPSELEDAEIKYELTTESGERAALSKRFGLKAIEVFDLILEIELLRKEDAIRLRGKFYASVIQSCVVSMVSVTNIIEEEFEIFFREESHIDSVGNEDIDELEPYFDDTIDIGDIASGELGLAIDPYPRAPGIADDAVKPYVRKREEVETKPFAGLAALKRNK